MAQVSFNLEQFYDPRWRLSNLYYITDKSGEKVKFVPNWAQSQLLGDLHYMNLILKARQFGFTTLIQLVMLDQVVFNENKRAGTIAHTLDDVKIIFRDKVKYPYDHLPEGLKNQVYTVQDTAQELLLSNNSSIRVGLSLRSGTLQYLHVSEYGKICAKFPEKAKEIRSGALNTLQAGNFLWIESTAEGQGGDFFDKSTQAEARALSDAPLTELDLKFHFFPWWRAPEYVLDPKGVLITSEFQNYFDDLKKDHNIDLTPDQKAWYVKKAEQQGDTMKREYPSTSKEAFETAVEGAYYAPQFTAIDKQRRVGEFPYDPDYPVYTAWDLGMSDDMAIWFFQIMPDGIRVIDYYKNNGEAIPHYARVLKEKPYRYAEKENCLVPHDSKVRELGTGKTRIETMINNGLRPKLVPLHNVADGIEAVRKELANCEFNEERTTPGLACLRAYRREWDDKNAIFKDNPAHDWASHGADAFRVLCMGVKKLKPAPKPKPAKTSLSLNDVWKQQPRTDERI